MSAFALGVFVSFAVYLAIGSVVGRRVRSVSDHYVAGWRAPTVLVTGSLVTSFLSTVAFMGNVLPTALGVLAVAGIMAAGLSSSTTFLSLIGFSASRDVLPQRIPEGARGRAARATERYAGVLAGSAVAAGIVLLLGYLLPFLDATG